MEALKKYIYSQIASGNMNKEDAKVILKEVFESSANNYKQKQSIAVIGMACNFPGANDLQKYWDILKNSEHSITEFPSSRRIDTDKFLPPEMLENGDPYRRGGYLERIDLFDCGVFRISPREAELMDPGQRLFLENTWKAIEDAGYGGDRLAGSRTGVYVGKDTSPRHEYKNMIKEQNAMTSTGFTTSILASRISYLLDLKGPSLVVDTACSSSLVAIHMACKALWDGDIDVAIAGGVSIYIMPLNGGVVTSTRQIISAFDKDADGTVWGEGIGTIVLKPLEDAIRDKDNIYSVITSTYANNDGASNGITAPSSEAQADVLKRAWKSSEINPETISYIETHGTGTNLGDPIEVKGISMALKDFTDKKQFCGIGSVKTNIGHTVGAAGISSFIKAVLSLKNHKLPASLNFNRPNPYIDFLKSPVYINDKLREWESGAFPRRCGVSSFGFSGTNCHITLEETPKLDKPQVKIGTNHVFTLSARTEEVLGKMIASYTDYLEYNQDISIGDLCSTVSKGRTHFAIRLAIIAKSIEELSQKIKKLQEIGAKNGAESLKGVFYGRHTIVMNKAEKESWEITEEEKISLSRKINNDVESLIDEKGSCQEMLEKISSEYVNGADINWAVIYRTGAYSTLSAPGYIFDHKRYWVEEQIQEQRRTDKTESKTIGSLSHPLLDACVAKILDESIFYTEFSVDRHWVLNEHLITGKNVVPGTTYIDMVLGAGREYFKQEALTIKNLQFYTPLVCGKNHIKGVYTVLRKDNDKVSFTVMSCEQANETASEDEWIKHCTGELYPISNDEVPKYNMEELFSSFGEEISFVRKKSSIMEFGTRWNCSRKVRFGEGQAIMNLELLEEVREDTIKHILHPALMDLATSIGANAIPHNNFYLPFVYGELHLYRNMPSNIYSRISPLLGEEHVDSEILKYDVEIIDEEGNVVAKVKDFTLKRVHDVRKRIKKLSAEEKLFYSKGWSEEQLKSQNSVKQSGATLVFADKGEYAKNLVKGLNNIGNEVITVCHGESFSKISEAEFTISGNEMDYLELFKELASNNITQIVHMQTVDCEKDIKTIEDLENGLENGVNSLFYITKSLYKNKITGNIKFFLVGKNIHEITKKESYIRPEPASLFGLAKVIVTENPALSCRCIDIDDVTSVDEIISELNAQDTTFLCAYRNGKRYVEVLNKNKGENPKDLNARIKPDGVYLVTGGLGGIGLEISKYICSKEKVSIALLSRSKLPERSKWDEIINDETDKKMAFRLANIKKLEEDAKAVEVFTADVSDYEDMKRVIEKLLKRYGRIDGIIHSAGIAGDGFIINKDIETFKNVLKPKINGTWILDSLTKELNLGFFILFSSIASMYGEAGQGDYTAANSYLDAYARYRNRYTGRTIVINWPAWREVGMAVDNKAVADRGISKALTTQEGINVFEEILETDSTYVIPIQFNNEYIDVESIEKHLPVMISEDVKEDLLRLSMQENTGTRLGMQKKQQSKVEITGKDKEDLTELETTVAKLWANVLGLQSIDLFEGFYAMGGDSLQAIQLLKEMENEFPGILNISDIFSYSTVSELSNYLERKIEEKKKRNKRSDNQSIDDVLEKLASGEIDAELAESLISLEGE